MADGFLTLEEYAERSATCWAARTRRDLEWLTRDLPDSEPAVSPVAQRSSDTDSVPATTTESKSGLLQRVAKGVGAVGVAAVAVFLGGQVLTSADGAAVFSSRTLQVSQHQDRVQVGAIFGSAEVVVPDGVTARTSGTMVFGSVECEQACRNPGDAREVVVEGRGGFGSVEIVTQQEHASGGLDDESEE